MKFNLNDFWAGHPFGNTNSMKALDSIVLVAGDKDYVPAAKKLKDNGFNFNVAFWNHAARELKEIAENFYNLDSYFDGIILSR